MSLIDTFYFRQVLILTIFTNKHLPVYTLGYINHDNTPDMLPVLKSLTGDYQLSLLGRLFISDNTGEKVSILPKSDQWLM
jgi:hypothetical protein